MIRRDLALQEVFSSIQGEGMLVGVRQIFVRLYGCHLDCVYCDTPETKTVLHPKGFSPPSFRVEDPPGSRVFISEPNPVDARRLCDLVLDMEARWGPHHSVSFTGGEPLLQAEALVEVVETLYDFGHGIYLETAGDLVRQFELIARWVQWVAMDIKLPSVTRDKDLFDRHEEFLEAVRETDAGVFAKCVVANDTEWEELERAARMTAKFGVPLVLQPVTPVAEGQLPPVPGKLLEWSASLQRINQQLRVIPQMHKRMGQL